VLEALELGSIGGGQEGHGIPRSMVTEDTRASVAGKAS